MSYCSLAALLDCYPTEGHLADESAVKAIALFDHEEVGSASAQGKATPVLELVLEVHPHIHIASASLCSRLVLEVCSHTVAAAPLLLKPVLEDPPLLIATATPWLQPVPCSSLAAGGPTCERHHSQGHCCPL